MNNSRNRGSLENGVYHNQNKTDFESEFEYSGARDRLYKEMADFGRDEQRQQNWKGDNLHQQDKERKFEFKDEQQQDWKRDQKLYGREVQQHCGREEYQQKCGHEDFQWQCGNQDYLQEQCIKGCSPGEQQSSRQKRIDYQPSYVQNDDQVNAYNDKEDEFQYGDGNKDDFNHYEGYRWIESLGSGKGLGVGRRKMSLHVSRHLVEDQNLLKDDRDELCKSTLREEESEDSFESCEENYESSDKNDESVSMSKKSDICHPETEVSTDLRHPGTAATQLLIHRSSQSRGCPLVDTFQQLGIGRPGIVHFLEEMGWSESTLIQSALWPAVARGYSVIGVADEGRGKTLGWLLPLINQLTDRINYHELPPGAGPRALVLAAGRRTVQEVVGKMEEVKRYSNVYLFVAGAYAGEDDEKLIGKLINGLDILVTTPSCLLRLIKRKITNLSRCCHLVVEEADRLLEWFPTETELVLNAWRSVNHHFVGLPEQTVVVAQQWTTGIRDFSDKLRELEPLIVFDNLEEAAVYGSLNIVPKLITGKEDGFKSIVEIVAMRGLSRVVICCAEEGVGRKIMEQLKKFEIKCIFLHENLNSHEYEDVWDSWVVNDINPLIVTDQAVLKITNLVPSHILIHWDLPRDRKMFACRFLWLKPAMKSFFKDPAALTYDFYNDYKPLGHVLLSKNDDLRYVMDFLQKISAVIPEELVLHHLEVRERMSTLNEKPLCKQLVSFGKCRDDVLGRCNQRHDILCNLEKPFKDIGAILKFRVLSVDSPVQYQVQVENTGEVLMVVVAGLSPLDRDVDWSDEVTELVDRKLINFGNPKSVIRGRVLLALGSTVWLKQCQVMGYQPKTQTFICNFETRRDLISGGYSMENPGHMEALLKLVDDAGISLNGSECKITEVEGGGIEESFLKKVHDIVNVHGQLDQKVDKIDEDSVQENVHGSKDILSPDDCLENAEDVDLEKIDYEEMLFYLMLINIEIIDMKWENDKKNEDHQKMHQDEFETENNKNVIDKCKDLQSIHEEEEKMHQDVIKVEDIIEEVDDFGDPCEKLEGGICGDIIENMLKALKTNITCPGSTSRILPVSTSSPANPITDKKNHLSSSIQSQARSSVIVKTPPAMHQDVIDKCKNLQIFFGEQENMHKEVIISEDNLEVVDNLSRAREMYLVENSEQDLEDDTFGDIIQANPIVKTPSGMACLAMVAGVTRLSELKPRIKWFQVNDKIIVNVSPAAADGVLPRDLSLNQVYVNVEQQHMSVQVLEVDETGHGEQLTINKTGRLEMFGKLDNSWANVKVIGRRLEVELRSKNGERWPRLTKQKHGWISVDHDRCPQDDDQEVADVWGEFFDREIGAECGAADGYFARETGDRYSWDNGEKVLPVDDINWTNQDRYRWNDGETFLPVENVAHQDRYNEESVDLMAAQDPNVLPLEDFMDC